MTDDSERHDTEPTDVTDMTAMAVVSNYKVLGQLDDGSGVGVLGQNDASQGTPIGVQGRRPSVP
jgi:hypothetical protein